MAAGAAPVFSATWFTIIGEVTAPLKSATKARGALAPLYWLVLGPLTAAGAATVAVAEYWGGRLSSQATTAPTASTGTRTRIQSRRRMMLR